MNNFLNSEIVSFRNQNLELSDISKLCSLLISNTVVKVLDLGDNEICYEGVKLIIELINGNKTLQIINLYGPSSYTNYIPLERELDCNRNTGIFAICYPRQWIRNDPTHFPIAGYYNNKGAVIITDVFCREVEAAITLDKNLMVKYKTLQYMQWVLNEFVIKPKLEGIKADFQKVSYLANAVIMSILAKVDIYTSHDKKIICGKYREDLRSVLKNYLRPHISKIMDQFISDEDIFQIANKSAVEPLIYQFNHTYTKMNIVSEENSRINNCLIL